MLKTIYLILFALLILSVPAIAQIDEDEFENDPYEENLPVDSTLPLSYLSLNYGYNFPTTGIYKSNNVTAGAVLSFDFLLYVYKSFGLSGVLFNNNYNFNPGPYKKQVEEQYPGGPFDYSIGDMVLMGFMIGPCYGVKTKKITLDFKLQLGAVDPDFPFFGASRIINGDTVVVRRSSDARTGLAVQPGVNVRYYLHPRIVLLGYVNYFFIRPRRDFSYYLQLTGKKFERTEWVEYPIISEIKVGFGIGYSLLK